MCKYHFKIVQQLLYDRSVPNWFEKFFELLIVYQKQS